MVTRGLLLGLANCEAADPDHLTDNHHAIAYR